MAENWTLLDSKQQNGYERENSALGRLQDNVVRRITEKEYSCKSLGQNISELLCLVVCLLSLLFGHEDGGSKFF
jgi:hypothetical protein